MFVCAQITNTPLFDSHHQQYTYTQGQIIYYIFQLYLFFSCILYIRSEFGSMAEKRIHNVNFSEKICYHKIVGGSVDVEIF